MRQHRNTPSAGSGNAWHDILQVVIPNADWLKDGAYSYLFKTVETYMRKRYSLPYEEDRPREGVYLLGPDGHEVLLRRVVSKTDDA